MLTTGREWVRGESQRGFSLVELMIAVIVVGILAAIALPAYQDQVRKSRRVDAYEALLLIQHLQEKWRASNSAYNDSLVDLGVDSAISRQGYYRLDVESANASGYTISARATEKGGQSSDTGCVAIVLTVNSGNPRGIRTPSGCW